MLKRASILLTIVTLSYFLVSVNAFSSSSSMSRTSSPARKPEEEEEEFAAGRALSLGADSLRTLVRDAARHDVSQTLDLSGITWMEHINLVVGSKSLAEHFYVDFLGCTKDASSSFHVNLGQQQFHLAEIPGEPAQIIAGSIGLTLPSLDTLRERIPAAQQVLHGTQFEIVQDDVESNGCLTLTCPWGNTMHLYSMENDSLEPTVDSKQKMTKIHAEGGAYGAHRMAVRGGPGIRFVELACPTGKAGVIAQFYKEMLHCTIFEKEGAAVISVGPGVHLAFVENEKVSKDDVKKMEGVHICFYANNFKALYHRLHEMGNIWTNPRFVHLDSCDTWEEAAASRTLRFKDIRDLATEEKLLELEHETRPLRHGQYLKVPKYEPK
jgi:hypothetical protein